MDLTETIKTLWINKYIEVCANEQTRIKVERGRAEERTLRVTRLYEDSDSPACTGDSIGAH